jgi:hypothetical protein
MTTQLLVAGPVRVTATVVGAGTQHEVDYFVAEIFRVADAGRFFDFLQFSVQGLAVEQLAGFRITVLLILDPEVCVKSRSGRKCSARIRVGFQISGLDLFADKFDISGSDSLSGAPDISLRVLRELLLFDLLFQAHRTGEPGWRRPRAWSKLNTLDRILNAKRVDRPFMPSSTPGASRGIPERLGFRIGILQAFAVIDPHLGVDAGVSGSFRRESTVKRASISSVSGRNGHGPASC